MLLPLLSLFLLLLQPSLPLLHRDGCGAARLLASHVPHASRTLDCWPLPRSSSSHASLLAACACLGAPVTHYCLNSSCPCTVPVGLSLPSCRRGERVEQERPASHGTLAQLACTHQTTREPSAARLVTPPDSASAHAASAQLAFLL